MSKWSKEDIIAFLIGLIGGPILLVILSFFYKPECPNCSQKLKKEIEKCPNCGIELIWKY